ncbi:hypothetical protein OG413_19385 [Streptomyces sp. NBC_01433]|uniref:SCO2400 family protein n=1 Tax=Streptomyces sp. NBC_01433 TaxID=2903864 RepID=UPI00225A0D60|nr:hypothetical protein [Streptomyces sp. NBC_01433]MCX4677437.1 hypothetical protein [Streptomyces sp. NBC_01433]
MDYCHPCQRHLNGALACAGCGTPVEALGPYAAPAYTGHEPEPPDEPPVPPVPPASGGQRRRARVAAGRAPRRSGREPEPADGGKRGGDGKSGGGRGKQRGGDSRGHRRRGRTALLTVLGLVLAAGALSLAELAVEPRHDDGAADYVRESTATRTEPAPEPSSSVRPERPGPPDTTPSDRTGPTGPTVVPVADSHPAGSGTGGGPGPEDSDASGPPQDSTPSSAPPGPGESGSPADPPGPEEPGDEPTGPAPTEPPEPDPEPTETCVRFLWWCT